MFPSSTVTDVLRYGPGEPGPVESIKKATFSRAGQTVLCTDSFVKHAFTFTPSFSCFVTCDSEEQIQRLTATLSEHGATLMTLGNHSFSRMFAWVNDRYGVSWQLNLD